MIIRAYNNDDNYKLLEIFRLNTPKYFAISEENDFVEYLNKYADNYYVVTDATTILGAGGINYGFDNGCTARISWDLIHPNSHGKGIGTLLAKYRIKKIKQNKSITRIVVRTTQLVYGFYNRMGFKLEKIEKDYWAPGFDLYLMKIEINNSTNDR